METSYYCQFCGEENDLVIDPGGGVSQEYVEDCQVCCRPNLLRIRIIDSESAEVTVQQEDE